MAKINGIDWDCVDSLEENIKNNFGSIKVFTSETILPYRKTLKIFKEKDFDKEFFEKVEVIYNESMEKRDVKENIPFRITDSERAKIRMCVLGNFDSYTAFCKKHKKFNTVYLTNVIKGNLKLKSLKYSQLVVLLNKKYDLGIEL